MQRWRGVEDIPTDWGKCVLTIGVFDGVHRGHAELIARAVQAGRDHGVPVVLMTFDPHPMEVVFPGSHPAQLQDRFARTGYAPRGSSAAVTAIREAVVPSGQG